MNLLLDTHVLIWWLEGSKHLGSGAKKAMLLPGVVLWISAVSVWEMAIKSGIGRLRLKELPETTIPTLLSHGLRDLPINIKHALTVRNLPLHHSDPFDRMLIAQAQCEELTLVTADPAIAAYDIRTIDASG
jgi:PIN domain nuclease of toxin-antitoxin system